MNANHATASLLDGTELGDVLDDLAGFAWIPGIGQILAGFRETAEAAAAGHLTTDQTQTTLAVTAGSPGVDLLTVLGLLARHLTDTNPALAAIPDDARKEAQRHTENLVRHLADDELHQHASEAAAAVDGI
jgi:hypothetical protein